MSSVNELARSLIFLGIVLIAAGVLLIFVGKVPGMGKFPGDILIKKENFTFYFPLGMSLALSLLATLILYFFHKH